MIPDIERRQIVDDAVAEVMARLQVRTSVPLQGEFSGGVLSLSFVEPAVTAVPAFEEIKNEPEVGKQTNPYTLYYGSGGDPTSPATDYYDATEPFKGADVDGNSFLPTYDSVKYLGPRIYTSGSNIGGFHDVVAGVDRAVYWQITTMFTRQITVNSLGIVTGIGPEQATVISFGYSYGTSPEPTPI